MFEKLDFLEKYIGYFPLEILNKYFARFIGIGLV